LAKEKKVDAIIGLGGGSPIGMAKAVAFALSEQPGRRISNIHIPTERPLIPVAAIPTTMPGRK